MTDKRTCSEPSCEKEPWSLLVKVRPEHQHCPGPCNNQWRRAERLRAANLKLNNEHIPVVGEPLWCKWCNASVVSSAVLGLLRQHELLEWNKGRATSDKGDGRGGSDGGTFTLTPEFNAQDEFSRSLVWTWEQTVRRIKAPETESDTFPDMAERYVTLTRSINFLTVHRDWILAQPEIGEDFGKEIVGEYKKLQRATKSGDRPEPAGVPCPHCDRKTLMYESGDDYYRCTSPDCLRLTSLDEFGVWIKHRAVLIAAMPKVRAMAKGNA
jgi:hypothetical protein